MTIYLKVDKLVLKMNNKFERLLDSSINRALNKFRLIPIKDLHHLEKIVLELNNKVDSLLE